MHRQRYSRNQSGKGQAASYLIGTVTVLSWHGRSCVNCSRFVWAQDLKQLTSSTVCTANRRWVRVSPIRSSILTFHIHMILPHTPLHPGARLELISKQFVYYKTQIRLQLVSFPAQKMTLIAR